ncbi:MAG: hypothetical protein AAB887_01860 [Patescibacteria group bacterium]
MDKYKSLLVDVIDNIFVEIIENNSGDLRIRLLKNLICSPHFELEKMLTLTITPVSSADVNSLIVAELVKVLNHLDFQSFVNEFKLIQKSPEKIKQSQLFWDIYYQWLTDNLTIKLTNNKSVSMISLGVGSGKVETQLDSVLKTKFPDLEANWIGIDQINYLSGDSIIATKGKFILSSNKPESYLQLTNLSLQDNVFLLANLSLHHMLIGPTEFLKKCNGIDNVVVLEELTDEKSYQDINYRIARVGYDLISNFLKNPEWASNFTRKPDNFKVDYWTTESVQRKFKIWNYSKPYSRNQILCKRHH